jgi:GT2 family glycosyltransferase
MPTYNGAAYLAAAISSVARQNDPDLEILAIDDGSHDDTLAILKACARHVPLRVIEQTHGGNWVASSNRGLRLAQGDWVCFLHQDDFWFDERLAQLRAALRRAPRATLVLHAAWFIDSRGRRLGLWRCPLPGGKAPLSAALLRERLLVQNFIAMPAPLFRREAALHVGGLDEQLWYTADWDFWLKLAGNGQAIYLPTALVGFRVHPESQTFRLSNRTSEFRRQLETVFERHVSALGDNGHAIRRAACFSIELNTLLASSMHGHGAPWPRIMGDWLNLGPAGWRRYLRDSRIHERIAARLRAHLHRGRI